MTSERERATDQHTFSVVRWLKSRGLRWPDFSGGISTQAKSNVVEVIDLTDGVRSSATYAAAIDGRGIFLTNQHVVSPAPPGTRPLQLKFGETERACEIRPRPDGVEADVALLTLDATALEEFEDAGLKPARLSFSLRFAGDIYMTGFPEGRGLKLLGAKLPFMAQLIPVPQLEASYLPADTLSDFVEPGMSGGAVYGGTLSRKLLSWLLPMPMKWDVFAIVGGMLTSDQKLRPGGHVVVILPQGLSVPLGAFADAFPDTVGRLRTRWRTRRLVKWLLALLVLALAVGAALAFALSVFAPAAQEPTASPSPTPARVDSRPRPAPQAAPLTVESFVRDGAFADVSGGAANLPDGTKLVVETMPASALTDDDPDAWTPSREAVVKGQRWEARGVPLRRPNQCVGEVRLRVALAREEGEDQHPAAIYSPARNVQVPEPKVWITRVNDKPVIGGEGPAIEPNKTVTVAGGAEHLMPGDTIWVKVYGEGPQKEAMWPPMGEKAGGWASHGGGGGTTWRRQVEINTAKETWTTFTIKAGVCSEPPTGNKLLFQEASGSSVTCKGGKVGRL